MHRQLNKFYIVVIADYNDDDAHGVVQDNLYFWFDQYDLSILELDRVDVSPFNTVETGYVLARRALNPLSPSRRQVFFVNTAPRLDDKAARRTNQGEGFVIARLRNGKHVFAVNSGASLSFIKPEIEKLNVFHVPEGSDAFPILMEALQATQGESNAGRYGAGQFRSGYIYPICTAKFLAGDVEPMAPEFSALLGPDLDPAIIPDVPENTVVYRDGYGNLKLSIDPSAIADHTGSFAVLECLGREVIAHIRSAIFDVPYGHFSFAPGSTILAHSDGTQRQFTELVLRGGHAARAFPQAREFEVRYPQSATSIHWRKAEATDFERLNYGADGTPPQDVLANALA